MLPTAGLSPDFVRLIPEGDTRERDVCASCGHVAYDNPKIIAGAVVSHAGQILLCRRAIEPRRGFWTLPAGYMELGETVAEAATREAQEEAGADIAIEGILAMFSISRIGQVQVLFRAGFAGSPDITAGEESLDVRLFDWADIPWDEIAFPSVHWALQAWHAAEGRPLGIPAGNPPVDPRGTGKLPDSPA
jgi:ADP-ribose pyrophosphatase YjhB (NUDIX family)